MATFDFPYHQVETEYPETGTRVKLGGSYTFTAAPDAPGQRIFTLKFETMCYRVTAGGVIDATTQPQLNAAALEAFYKAHELWKTFDYVHPIYGTLKCKFNKPLKIPKGKVRGNGWLEAFDLELIEQP